MRNNISIYDDLNQMKDKLIFIIDDLYKRIAEVQNMDFQDQAITSVDSDQSTKKHAINSATYHSSTIGSGSVLMADSNGLPADSGVADISGTNFNIGGSTNYVTVSNTGDILFLGSSGLAFGEIYVKGNGTATTLNSSGYVQILIFGTNGVSNNTTPDHTNDHITITNAGMYFCSVSMSVSNGAGVGHEVDIDLRKNNGASAFDNVHANRTLSAGTDIGSITMSGIIDCAANDTIELWAITDRALDSDVTIVDATLSLIQVGGT